MGIFAATSFVRDTTAGLGEGSTLRAAGACPFRTSGHQHFYSQLPGNWNRWMALFFNSRFRSDSSRLLRQAALLMASPVSCDLSPELGCL